MELKRHEEFMRIAMMHAEASMNSGNRPIGAVITHGDNVVGGAGNAIASEHSKIAHAELRAIESCSTYLLEHGEDCTIYTTHQPCIMCLGAIAISNIRRVVYSLPDPESPSRDVIAQIPYLQERIDYFKGGVLKQECGELWDQWLAAGGNGQSPTKPCKTTK